MRRPRGFTIIEVMLATALLLYAVIAFSNIYLTTARYEVHSQNRVLASLLGESLMDEIEAHPFGEVAPQDWKMTGMSGEWTHSEFLSIVEGRKVMCEFHVQRSLKNGAFLDHHVSSADWDLVTVVISWREGSNPIDASAGPYFPGDNLHLVIQVPVWR